MCFTLMVCCDPCERSSYPCVRVPARCGLWCLVTCYTAVCDCHHMVREYRRGREEAAHQRTDFSRIDTEPAPVPPMMLAPVPSADDAV
jgi:hypothetical protein